MKCWSGGIIRIMPWYEMKFECIYIIIMKLYMILACSYRDDISMFLCPVRKPCVGRLRSTSDRMTPSSIVHTGWTLPRHHLLNCLFQTSIRTWRTSLRLPHTIRWERVHGVTLSKPVSTVSNARHWSLEWTRSNVKFTTAALILMKSSKYHLTLNVKNQLYIYITD